MKTALDKYSLQEFVPKKIAFIDQMMVERFHAISVDKSNGKIARVMEDSFIPSYDTICGVYCIYRKSVLDILNGSITSFSSYEFETACSSDKLITEENVEDVLDFATMVIIASEDKKYMSHYFIGGNSKKLNSILNVCSGFPTSANKKNSNHTINCFKEDVSVVENMDYLENILNEVV
jgi:hypothetical protein